MSVPPLPQSDLNKNSLPYQFDDPATNKVINEISSGTSSPDPVVLPPLPEKKRSSTFLNILLSILILVSGGIASYYLLASMYKGYSLPKTSMINAPAEETIILTEQYINPFTEQAQYTNPFSTPSANPFEALASQ